MFCPFCGKKLDNQASFCPFCGKEIVKNEHTEGFPANTDILQPDAENSSVVDHPADQSVKKRPSVFIGIGIVAIVIVILAVCFYFFIRPQLMNKNRQAAASTNTYTEIKEPEAQTTPAVKEEETKEEETKETREEIETKTTAPQSVIESQTTDAQFPKVMKTTAESGLLLRDGPGKQYTAIYVIPYGTSITVEKIEKNWAYTSVAGMTGWCSCDYLK